VKNRNAGVITITTALLHKLLKLEEEVSIKAVKGDRFLHLTNGTIEILLEGDNLPETQEGTVPAHTPLCWVQKDK